MKLVLAAGVVAMLLGIVSGPALIAFLRRNDPATNRWSTKAPMPVAIDSMYAAAVGNVIYIVGGFNPLGGHSPLVRKASR